MVQSLFLYEDPFVAKDTEQHRFQYLSQTIRTDNFERDDEELVRSIILRFIVDRRLVVIHKEKLVQNSGDNIGSWQWLVNWRSFRGLVDPDNLATVMNILSAGDGEILTEIFDLHARLGMLTDHSLLNSLVNRTIRSISLIPYSVKEDKTPLRWDDIHTEYPFLWLLILMQSIIRNETLIQG